MSYTVILTASNPKNDLEYLRKEFQNLNDHFSAPAATGVVHPVINMNATEEAVFSAYLSMADIRLFHFSGHAGDGNLLMDDGQLSRGNIMAAMMRYAKHLKLVFLNGCATYELVDKFLKYGANMVIATKAPVFDRVACNFSSVFYDCLCNRNFTIAQSFDTARQSIKNKVKERLAEIKDIVDNGKNDVEYIKMLDEFERSDVARTIVKDRTDANDRFQWGVYHKSDSSQNLQQQYENWRLLDNSPQLPPNHLAPSFDFLKGLAKAVIDLKKTLPKKPADPHLKGFDEIEKQYPQAVFWEAEATSDLTKALKDALLLPLKKPFDNLINYSKDKQDALLKSETEEVKDLLHYQLRLYETFMRTCAVIMLSDFMETTMRVGFSHNKELKKKYINSLNNTQVLSTLFQQIINGDRNLNDVEFSIYVMRSIVSFFNDASQNVAEEDKEVFQQFVKEYNGNTLGSKVDIAILNSIHEVLIEILKKSESGLFEQSPGKTLRCYCDRVETALIELFMNHKYVLLYEIITVGKVEANRRRDTLLRTINHDIFTFEGLLPPSITRYGEEFAENYSVILVSHKSVFLKYLSLSPFIINVGPFLEEDKSIFYYFSGKSGSDIHYVGLDDDSKPVLKMDSRSGYDIINNVSDTSFLTLNEFDSRIYNARDTKIKIRARKRFARARDQFKRMFYYYMILKRSIKAN